MAPSCEVTIGIPLYDFQALDVIGPMDIIHTASYQALSMIFSEEEAARVKAPKVNFEWIASDSATEPQMTTGRMAIKATTTYSTCPKLDYLLIGGPAPQFATNLPQDLKEFIRAKAAEVSVIFCTCTGALVLAGTGVLDGIPATVNHLFVDFGKEHFPAVKWDKGPNWVVAEGSQKQKIWTASGAGAGMDMVAQFCRENFGEDWLNYSTSLLEWQPRDVKGTGVKFMNGRKEIVPASEIVAN